MLESIYVPHCHHSGVPYLAALRYSLVLRVTFIAHRLLLALY